MRPSFFLFFFVFFRQKNYEEYSRKEMTTDFFSILKQNPWHFS